MPRAPHAQGHQPETWRSSRGPQGTQRCYALSWNRRDALALSGAAVGAGVAPAHSLENRPSLAEAARSASVEPSALTPQEAQIESVFEQARFGVVAVYDAVTLSTAASQRALQEGNGSGYIPSGVQVDAPINVGNS